MNIKPLLTLVFCLVLINLHGQSFDMPAQTKAFIEAYSDKNFEGMAAFYHDSIRYQDPTAAAFGMELDLKGKDQFISMFNRMITMDFVAMNIKIENAFYTKTHAVLNVRYNASIKGSYFGKDESLQVDISIPMITTLKFEGGKIINHVDYVNYTLYQKQLKEQFN